MKTHAILILLLMTLSATVYSQKAGLKVGANFTNLYIDDVDDENMKVGLNLGVYYRADLSESFGIQPELLFTQKGSEVQYNAILFGNDGTYRFNLNYLELPVLFVGKINNFHISAGPYVAILMAAKVKRVNDGGEIQDIESLDRDSFNTFDKGVAAGVGFDFNRGMLGLRYSYGLGEIGNSEAAVQATSNSKNSALQAFVGFDF